MSAPELLFRALQMGVRARDWWRYRSGTPRGQRMFRRGYEGGLEGLVALDRPFLPLLRDLGAARLVRESEGVVLSEAVAEAERLLSGEWYMFGRQVGVQAEPDWHRDPVHGKVWPRRFYGAVDHRGGGAKYVWEPSRHQHIATLARAYVWTGEHRFAARALDLLRSWIQANPPYEGVHWTSPMECALRLISWSLVFHATRSSGLWDDRALLSFLGSLVTQARFIEDHPSRFSSANNHAIAEAAGLACVGLAFPELRWAGRWRQKGLAHLARELERQVLPDGTGAEQAPHYLACILDYGLFVTALATECQVTVPPIIGQRMVQGARYLEQLGAGGCQVPAIGDADDSRAVPLDAMTVNVFDAVRIGVAAMFGVASLKRPGDRPLERLYWLGGVGAAESFARLEPNASAPHSEAFPHGGCVIVVPPQRDERALMDVGPLGYLSIAAHGHADALSVVLDVGGEPLFVDAGTYVYHEDAAWRGYFRGSQAHNTVVVGGRDQSEPLGDTLWGRPARVAPELVLLNTRVQVVAARHDGYCRLRPPVTHRRVLLSVANDYWLFVDSIEGDVVPAVELNWHLMESTAVVRGAVEEWLLTTGSGRTCYVVVGSSRPVARAVVSGRESPPQGWLSVSYGERHEAPVLTATAAPGPALAMATLVSRGAVSVETARLPDGGALVRVADADWADTVMLPSEPSRTMVADQLRFNGLVAVVRRARAAGEVLGYAVGGGNRLALGEERLWESGGAQPSQGDGGVLRSLAAR